jgi:hypothetical protein
MKTTIEMAREAAGDDWGLFQEYMPEIHRLVELVRADERARMATDKSKEAMKLALEALEYIRNIDTEVASQIKYGNAAKFFEEALVEQPAAQQEPVAQWQKKHAARTDGKWENTNEHDAKWWRDNAQGWEIRALYTSPQPAAQQEPVAWANSNDLQNFDMKVRTNGGPLHTVPLYTSPPAQRKPLTDEEMADFLGDRYHSMTENELEFFRLGEAAHGIKENT